MVGTNRIPASQPKPRIRWPRRLPRLLRLVNSRLALLLRDPKRSARHRRSSHSFISSDSSRGNRGFDLSGPIISQTNLGKKKNNKIKN